MKCYFTGEECDCGGHMDTECPHDEMSHDELPGEESDDPEEFYAVEHQMSDMSERLDQCLVVR